jgi:hypothetical protein
VNLDVEVAHQFVLVQFTVVDHCADEAVLGMDFLAANGTSWDWDNGELAFRGGPTVFAQPKDTNPNSPADKAHRVRLSEEAVLPSNMITMVKVAVTSRGTLPVAGQVSRVRHTMSEYGVVVARCVIDPRKDELYVPVMNPTDSTAVLPSGTTVGLLAPVSSITPTQKPGTVDKAQGAAPTTQQEDGRQGTIPVVKGEIDLLMAPCLTPTRVGRGDDADVQSVAARAGTEYGATSKPNGGGWSDASWRTDTATSGSDSLASTPAASSDKVNSIPGILEMWQGSALPFDLAEEDNSCSERQIKSKRLSGLCHPPEAGGRNQLVQLNRRPVSPHMTTQFRRRPRFKPAKRALHHCL